jgi:hypothetical protein
MKCKHIKSNGEQCKSNAMKDSSYCWTHSPEISIHEKKLGASKGGKNKYNLTPVSLPQIIINDSRDVPPLLVDTIQRLRCGEIDIRLGTAIGYLSNVLLKSYEVSDLEGRIEKMENFVDENFKEEYHVSKNAWEPV